MKMSSTILCKFLSHCHVYSYPILSNFHSLNIVYCYYIVVILSILLMCTAYKEDPTSDWELINYQQFYDLVWTAAKAFIKVNKNLFLIFLIFKCCVKFFSSTLTVCETKAPGRHI